jgi:hypothetical protein
MNLFITYLIVYPGRMISGEWNAGPVRIHRATTFVQAPRRRMHEAAAN